MNDTICEGPVMVQVLGDAMLDTILAHGKTSPNITMAEMTAAFAYATCITAKAYPDPEGFKMIVAKAITES